MTIDLFYDSLVECKSQIFAIVVVMPTCHITWHFFDQEGYKKSVFYQSNVLSDETVHELLTEVKKLMVEKKVPEWIFCTFKENLLVHNDYFDAVSR
jgi:hypothetical protein